MITKEIPCKRCISLAICKGKISETPLNNVSSSRASRSILEEKCIILYSFVISEGLCYTEIELKKVYGKQFRLSISCSST